jgi:NAD(P)-dependent dehydrogenase (short-subunit alcohol dehydrogenase family)
MSFAPATNGAARIFTMEDQVAFANISGDRNPIHVDPLYARRLLAGGAVVHGIHLLLWALDWWAQGSSRPLSLTAVSASFRRPVRVGTTASVNLAGNVDRSVSLALMADGIEVATIDAQWRDENRAGTQVSSDLPPLSTIADTAPDRLAEQEGAIPLLLDRQHSRKLWPHLTERMSADQIAALLATTRVVGVECPGRHSLFAGLDLHEHSSPSPTLRYRVTKYDRRFRLTTIAMDAAGLAGTVTALIRPLPAKQPQSREIATVVRPDEFCNQSAIVIGGSRGLGEVTAKILACGGAEVLLTYQQGQQDAEAIVDDIVSTGGRARCVQFDVMSAAPLTGQRSPTHLYYMATPFIDAGEPGSFRNDVFARLSSFYVTGFDSTFRALRTPELRFVFYPSTAFLDQPIATMAEYAAAKAAGEDVCRQLQRESPGVRVVAPRLPRMLTDQTTGVSSNNRQEALSVMLDAIRSLAAA